MLSSGHGEGMALANFQLLWLLVHDLTKPRQKFHYRLGRWSSGDTPCLGIIDS